MYSRRAFLGASFGLTALPFIGQFPAGAQETSDRMALTDSAFSRYLAQSPHSIASLAQSTPFTFGDAKLQMDTLGLPLPFDLADDDARRNWVAGSYSIALPQVLRTNGLRDDFRELTGFEIGQVFSGAEIGEPPAMAMMIQGDFESAAIQAAQQSLGYQKTEVAGYPVWTIGPDGEFDFSNPIQKMALARMNNAAFLDDGTLVYTPTLELMGKMLNPGETLDQLPLVQQAVAGLAGPICSAVLLGPGGFLPDIAGMLMASPQTNQEISEFILAAQSQHSAPIVLAAIVGITAGGPLWQSGGEPLVERPDVPKSVGLFSLVYASADEAAVAAKQIEERLATGQSSVMQQPWSEMLTSWSAVAQETTNTVLVTLEWPKVPRPFDLVMTRDIGFITG